MAEGKLMTLGALYLQKRLQFLAQFFSSLQSQNGNEQVSSEEFITSCSSPGFQVPFKCLYCAPLQFILKRIIGQQILLFYARHIEFQKTHLNKKEKDFAKVQHTACWVIEGFLLHQK